MRPAFCRWLPFLLAIGSPAAAGEPAKGGGGKASSGSPTEVRTGHRASSRLTAPREKGVALGLFSQDASFDYGPLIAEVGETGATHLSVTTVWWQDNIGATEIRKVSTWTPSDEQVLASIRAARSSGLHVTLFPIVRLIRSTREEWRGRIAPLDETAWWQSYEGFILHQAGLAKAAGAHRLCIGSELLSMEAQRERWLRLIERVRLEAPELEILYSANWDHYRVVSFWDAVDVVGLTGYWELTKDLEASEETMLRAWSAAKKELTAFSAELGRPLVITEIGYPSIDGGAAWPWDETRRAKIDLEEQRRAYRAFVRAWSGSQILSGVYFWNWFGFGGDEDGGYTPRGKPAAEVLTRWYRESRLPEAARAAVSAPRLTAPQ